MGNFEENLVLNELRSRQREKENKMENLENLQLECFKNEMNHGFHDGTKLTFNDKEKDLNVFYRKIALLHSEISELIESMRQNQLFVPCDKKNLNMSNAAEELGDIQIRLFTLAEFLNIDVLSAARIKHEYNKTRPFLHGKNS